LSEIKPVLEQLVHADSTNAELLRRLRAGNSGLMAIYALTQSAGRGRNGKSWDAPLCGLYYSQTLHFNRAPNALAGLSLALGIAAVEAIHEANASSVKLDIALKWPNDLWIAARKLGGILIEIAANTHADPCAQTTVVAGIGINLAGAIGTDRTDLAAHGVALDAPTLAPIILKHWLLAAAAFNRAGFANFSARWAKLDALAGKSVRLSDQSDTIWQAAGVGPDGALMLQGANGQQRSVASGEVTLSTRLVQNSGPR